MAEVNLTQEISNEGEQKGYIDDLIAEIKAVEDGEELIMPHTCVGGDVFQGDRINRAVLEHKGKTHAIVIGLAASMGGVNLSAYDEIEIDEDARIMLHKAHIPELAVEDYTPEQTQMCNDFNQRAYARLIRKGMNKEILDEIFLSAETKDKWFTAKEAEAAGLGYVTRIERRDSQPFKVAAKLNIESIKNDYKKMGLFNKNKSTLRIVAAHDGRQLAFNSESEEVAKGDILQLVGSNESLQGKIKISATLEATVDEENKVVDLEEVAPEAIEDDGEMVGRIEALESAIAEILKKVGGEEEEAETPEAKAEAEAAAKAEADEKEEEVEKVKALLSDALKAAATIKSGLKLQQGSEKHEEVLSNLTESEKNVAGMIELRNKLANEKITG